MGGKGHFAAEHEVGFGGGDPVVAACEFALVGVDHVDVKLTGSGAGAGIVEIHAHDHAFHANLFGSVDLLRQGVAIKGVGGDVLVGGGASKTNDDFVGRLESDGVAPCAFVVFAANGHNRPTVEDVGDQTLEGVDRVGDTGDISVVSCPDEFPFGLLVATVPAQGGRGLGDF